MNKKLFAMMMVPVIVVMGGTFAFSAWSGSANAFFNNQAATVGYTETLNFMGTNANINPITVSNGAGSHVVNSTTAMYTVDSQTGGAASTLNVYANGSGLVPGDYVEFQVTITNTGSAVLNTSLVGIDSVAVYNSNGQLITGNDVPIAELQPPVTVGSAYFNNLLNTGNYGNGVVYSGVGYLINATTTGSTPASLAHGQSITYSVFAILPMTSTTSGGHLSVSISIPISVDQ